VLFTMLLCVAVGLFAERSVAKSYSSQADLLISPVDNGDTTFIGISVFRNISADPTSNVLTLSRYIDTEETATIVKRNLKLTQSPADLLGMIKINPLTQTGIVSIGAKTGSPQLAAAVANGFADATLQRRTQLVQSDVKKVASRLQTELARSQGTGAPGLSVVQARLAGLRSLVGLPDPSLSVLNRAQVPTAPDGRSTKLIVIATALAGLLLGFGLALLAYTLGGVIRNESELLARSRAPILGRIPRLSTSLVRGYFAGSRNLPPMAWEAYRSLRTNILRAAVPGDPPVILVTSAMPGEGKTFTAVNLAVTLAAQHSRVVLIDCDFRRPMIANVFGVAAPRDGFAAMFMEGEPGKAMRDAPGHQNLKLALPTLTDLAQVDELDTARASKAFNWLRRNADVIVVDSAPTDVSDPLILASAADMVLVSVQIGQTRRSRYEALQEAFSQYGVPTTGLVVTSRENAKEVMYGSTMPVPLEFRPPAAAPRLQALEGKKARRFDSGPQS
jgi:tyrosine-protein kinase